MTTGVVFGVFDGLHDGHRAMLREAHKSVDRLIAIVPSDDMVRTLKGRSPKHPCNDRKLALLAENLVENTRIGDEALGEYHVLDEIQPDVIFLGYDQIDLKHDLERYQELHPTPYTLHTLTPHHPDRYKSSLLNSV